MAAPGGGDTAAKIRRLQQTPPVPVDVHGYAHVTVPQPDASLHPDKPHEQLDCKAGYGTNASGLTPRKIAERTGGIPGC
jgi:hypothetical protein